MPERPLVMVQVAANNIQVASLTLRWQKGDRSGHNSLDLGGTIRTNQRRAAGSVENVNTQLSCPPKLEAAPSFTSSKCIVVIDDSDWKQLLCITELGPVTRRR